ADREFDRIGDHSRLIMSYFKRKKIERKKEIIAKMIILSIFVHNSHAQRDHLVHFRPYWPSVNSGGPSN
ncbi:MAG: hypothetical protein ACHQUC_03745, partial [Chlamydiales bacterium]